MRDEGAILERQEGRAGGASVWDLMAAGSRSGRASRRRFDQHRRDSSRYWRRCRSSSPVTETPLSAADSIWWLDDLFGLCEHRAFGSTAYVATRLAFATGALTPWQVALIALVLLLLGVVLAKPEQVV